MDMFRNSQLKFAELGMMCFQLKGVNFLGCANQIKIINYTLLKINVKIIIITWPHTLHIVRLIDQKLHNLRKQKLT